MGLGYARANATRAGSEPDSITHLHCRSGNGSAPSTSHLRYIACKSQARAEGGISGCRPSQLSRRVLVRHSLGSKRKPDLPYRKDAQITQSMYGQCSLEWDIVLLGYMCCSGFVLEEGRLIPFPRYSTSGVIGAGTVSAHER